MNIAIIPARGGSKRIPRKNIRDFCGKPMIAWSIETALKSGVFTRVLVSTDDPEIKQISIACGAEVPFDRPSELSNDHAGTLPVIRHAVQWLLDHGVPVEKTCCLYATSPFTTPADLRSGLDLLAGDNTVDFTFSITPFEFPIQRALKINPNHEVTMFWPEHELTRSQDLPAAYHDAGQFYWGTTRAWLHCERIYSAHSRGVGLPPHRVQDIDTEEDWLHAEIKHRSMGLGFHE